jgi:hypothetical protein
VSGGVDVDATKSRKLLREILAVGTLTYSGHAKKEMEKDKPNHPSSSMVLGGIA